MGKEILLIGVSILGVAVIRSGVLSPSHDFSQNIAECKAMSDVTFIVEGRFKKPKKLLEKSAQFDEVRAKVDKEEIPPKPIYLFRADVVHLGSTGVTNNKNGKQLVKSVAYKIREGEAPEGLKGKGLICYKGSNPRTIKSIHYP